MTIDWKARAERAEAAVSTLTAQLEEERCTAAELHTRAEQAERERDWAQGEVEGVRKVLDGERAARARAEADNAVLLDSVIRCHPCIDIACGACFERSGIIQRRDAHPGAALLERHAVDVADLRHTISEMEKNRIDSINVTTRREYALLEYIRALEKVRDAVQSCWEKLCIRDMSTCVACNELRSACSAADALKVKP